MCDKILTADYVESHFSFTNKFKVKLGKKLLIAYYKSIDLYHNSMLQQIIMNIFERKLLLEYRSKKFIAFDVPERDVNALRL